MLGCASKNDPQFRSALVRKTRSGRPPQRLDPRAPACFRPVFATHPKPDGGGSITANDLGRAQPRGSANRLLTERPSGALVCARFLIERTRPDLTDLLEGDAASLPDLFLAHADENALRANVASQ